MFQIIFGKNLTDKLRIVDAEKEDLLKTLDTLRREKSELQIEVDGLKKKRKIEEEDIKHMLKMQEEKGALEKQKFEVAETARKNDAIAKVKDEYRDKLEGFLVTKNEEADKRFQLILERLPNVNMSIKQSSGKK